jgi:lipoprotein-anchoring transpeptidase ErfK/SrfK
VRKIIDIASVKTIKLAYAVALPILFMLDVYVAYWRQSKGNSLMVWQRVSLAIALAVGSAFLSQSALAQAADPASADPAVGDVGPAPARATDAAKPEHVDHSEPMPRDTVGPKVIIRADLSTQQMHVTFPDGSEADWPIASGRPGLDTPDGNYKPQWIDPDHVSKQYQDAPMPYAIFFDLKGHAIHGSYEKTFGKAVSHGCIRLQVPNAKRLFEAVKVSGAEIDVVGRAPRGPGALVARRAPPAYQDQAADGSYADNGYGYQRRSAYGGGYYQQRSPYPPYPGGGYAAAPRPQGGLFGLFGN